MADKYAHIEELIAWIDREAQLYDEQGLTVDMQHADKLFAVKRGMQQMLAVVRAAKPLHASSPYADFVKKDEVIAKLEADDDHQDRVINVLGKGSLTIPEGRNHAVIFLESAGKNNGPEGLDDVCPIREIERLRAALERIAAPYGGDYHGLRCQDIAREALKLEADDG